jgi:hypothetical protein
MPREATSMRVLRRGDVAAIVCAVLALLVSTRDVFGGESATYSMWGYIGDGLPLLLLLGSAIAALLAAPVPLWLGAGSPPNPGAARTFGLSTCFLLLGDALASIPKTMWFWVMFLLVIGMTVALFTTQRWPLLAHVVWTPSGVPVADGQLPPPGQSGAEFVPFWIAVPDARPCFDPQSGAATATLSPDDWYLAVEERVDGLVVQVDEARVLLRDTSFLIRG